MEVYDSKTGPNLAVGRPVTSLDSIEAAPRWRKPISPMASPPKAAARRTSRSSSANAMPSCSRRPMKPRRRNCVKHASSAMPCRNCPRRRKSMPEPSTTAAAPSKARRRHPTRHPSAQTRRHEATCAGSGGPGTVKALSELSSQCRLKSWRSRIRPSCRFGEVDHGQEQRAHLAQHREPRVAASLRSRPGRDRERLRPHGRQAEPS
jgi:hypothetical protein